MKEYEPTMLFVEHDYFFCEEIATDKLVVKKSRDKKQKKVANRHI